MDTRVDVLAVLGLRLGEAHVLRNAGGRVTDDVVRSLTLSTHLFGIDSVVLMQHTHCGLADRTREELTRITGVDLEFLPISDHVAALGEDIRELVSRTFLSQIKTITGMIYDLDEGVVAEVVRWGRDE